MSGYDYNEEFLIRKSTADDGKITYVVLDACDGYGNATQGGGAVREFYGPEISAAVWKTRGTDYRYNPEGN